MSKYTTGEIAKLCNVSVRTVQYYDTKEILVPAEIASNGRRIYSDEEVKKLQLICLLKSLGLKLTRIKEILSSEYAVNTLVLILNEQAKQLNNEIKERQNQLEAVESIKGIIQNSETIPTEILTDMEQIMKDTKKLKKVHYALIATGIVGSLIEYSTLTWWLTKGNWFPFAFGMSITLFVIGLFTRYYRKNINYICPKCNTIFHPAFIHFAFAKHTFKTRHLKCPNCRQISNCVETTTAISKKTQIESIVDL